MFTKSLSVFSKIVSIFVLLPFYLATHISNYKITIGHVRPMHIPLYIIMKTLLPLLSLFLLVQISCNKDDDTPAPPITQENTFSCKINGETFVPKDYIGFYNMPGIQASVHTYTTNNWEFYLSNAQKDIYIYIVQVDKTGDYTLTVSDGDGDFLFDENTAMEFDDNGNYPPSHISTNSSGTFYVTDLEVNKKIILEFDKIELINKDNSDDKVTLTEGKLNINLETLNQD